MGGGGGPSARRAGGRGWRCRPLSPQLVGFRPLPERPSSHARMDPYAHSYESTRTRAGRYYPVAFVLESSTSRWMLYVRRLHHGIGNDTTVHRAIQTHDRHEMRGARASWPERYRQVQGTGQRIVFNRVLVVPYV